LIVMTASFAPPLRWIFTAKSAVSSNPQVNQLI